MNDCQAIAQINLAISEFDKRAGSLSGSAARFSLLDTFITIVLGFTSAALVVLSSLNLSDPTVGAAILGIQLTSALFVSIKITIDPSKKCAVFLQCAKEYNNIKRDLVTIRDEWRFSSLSAAELGEKYIELARELNKKEDKIYADQPLQVFSNRADHDYKGF
jgi:hypothetical protein